MKWKEIQTELTRKVTKEEALEWLSETSRIWYEHMAFLLLAVLCLIPVLLIPVDLISGKINMLTGIDKLWFSIIGNLCIALALMFVACSFIRNRLAGVSSFSWLKQRPYLLFLFLLLIWSLIASFMAADKYTAFFGTVYRADGFFTFCRSIGIFFCAFLLKDSKKIRNLLRIFVVTACLTSLVTVFQKLGSTVFLESFAFPNALIFYNTNHTAYYLTMSVLASNSLFLIENKISWRLFALACGVFELWALIQANTFGSYLAVFAACVFALILFSRASGKIKFLYFVPLLVFCVITLMNFPQIMNDLSRLQGDVALISQNQADANAAGSGRWLIWKLSVGYIIEKPIFGFGPEGLYSLYLSAGLNIDRPHNEFLQYAAFTGIPGMLFYLGFLVSLFLCRWREIKSCSSEALAAALCVFGYIGSSMLGNTMFNTVPFYFMLLGLAAAGGPDSLYKRDDLSTFTSTFTIAQLKKSW